MNLDILTAALRGMAAHSGESDEAKVHLLMQDGLSEAEAVRLVWFAPYAFAKDRIELLGFECDDFVEIVPSDDPALCAAEADAIGFLTLFVLQPEYISCIGLLAAHPPGSENGISQDDFTQIVLGSVWVNMASEILTRGEKPTGHVLRAALHSDRPAKHAIRLAD